MYRGFLRITTLKFPVLNCYALAPVFGSARTNGTRFDRKQQPAGLVHGNHRSHRLDASAVPTTTFHTRCLTKP